MNILVCGGKSEADYVLSAFKKHGNRIVVINDDDETAELLSEHYDLDIFKSDPSKIYSFEVADVYNFDLVVSLMERDAENFVVCKIAKELFHIKKAICTVSNPNNVAVFQRLGIDSPISASYLLTERIRGESDVESIFRTLSLEDEKIVITEVKVMDTFPCINQTLAQLRLPNTGNITCIFRDPDVIIPRGNTTIQSGDTIVIASSQENQQELIDYLKYGPDEELQKQRQMEALDTKARQDEETAKQIAKRELEMKEAIEAALSSANEKFELEKQQLQEQIDNQNKQILELSQSKLEATEETNRLDTKDEEIPVVQFEKKTSRQRKQTSLENNENEEK